MINVRNINNLEAASQLEALCGQRVSGLLLVTPENSPPAQITLLNGQITAIRFLRQRGKEALEALFKFSQFKAFSFVERDSADKNRQQRSAPLTHADVLGIIGNVAASTSPKQARANPSRTVTANREKPALKVEKAKQIVIDELTFVIGPMAALVGDNYLSNAHNLAEVKQATEDIAASTIDSLTERSKFKHAVLSKLA